MRLFWVARNAYGVCRPTRFKPSHLAIILAIFIARDRIVLLEQGVIRLIRALSNEQRPLWLWIQPVLIALLIPALVISRLL